MRGLSTIKGKNGELYHGYLKWIDVPENSVGEFWFYTRLSPRGFWGKLDYWEVLVDGNGGKR